MTARMDWDKANRKARNHFDIQAEYIEAAARKSGRPRCRHCGITVTKKTATRNRRGSGYVHTNASFCRMAMVFIPDEKDRWRQ